MGMTVLLMFFAFALAAQESIKIEGTVYDARSRKPMADVVITSPQSVQSRSVQTDENGRFTIEVKNRRSILTVQNLGYITQEIVPGRKNEVSVYLLPEDTYLEGDGYRSMGVYHPLKGQRGTAVSLRQRDLNSAINTADEALPGKIPGLRVISKSGMPGEGAALFNRGIRSLSGENTPLIVVDGMPYMPDMEVSGTVNGFSRNIFLPVNLKETGRISFLRGADAGMYGSLGSNGVLLIESENATDLETKVEFHTVEGVSWFAKRLPLLNARQSKNFLADVGENKYSNPEELVDKLPFLEDDPDNPTNYLYNHDTDWQDEVFVPAFVSENVLKVKGGDAVAKYAINVGTQQNSGVLDNTHLSKFFTRMVANVNFSRRLTAMFGAVMNINNYKLHEQGMAPKTNPYLASLYQAPFMSVYKQARKMDENGNEEFVFVDFYNPVHEELQLTNPVAAVNDIKADSRSYNIMVNIDFEYSIFSYLKAKAMFGLFFDQNRENIFIPGKNSHAIAPLRDSLAINTARAMVGKGLNYYGRFGLYYNRTFNDWNNLEVYAVGQLLTSRKELDAGEGANTPTDYYTMLSNVTEGRMVSGDMEKWSWMNYCLNVDYSLARQLYVGAGVTLDGASSYGANSGRWFAFPYVKGAWRIKESPWLKSVKWLSDLTLRGEYSLSGNSRFSSKLSKNYYTSVPYLWSAGLYRKGLGNSGLKPEKVSASSVGVDFAMVGNRVNIGVDLYREVTKDAVIDNRQAAVYGYPVRYENAGELKTDGVEVNFRFNLFNNKSWNWLVGGNIAHYKSEVKSLGNECRRTLDYGDGVSLLLEDGRSPYLFYGYRAEKIFSTTTEANNSGYRNESGEAFVAGDVKFADLNGDKFINDEDREVIGDPTPDFYGAFYTDLSYRNWNLYLNFTYSYGNDIYNAVRRSLGSMKDFSNQDHSVDRRWSIEGQDTDIPRASYGDPHDNSRFSSRWIDDGSYLRLKEVTLSYDTKKKVGLFTNIRVYATGENLLTFTKYLGLDPEFSYSYDPRLLGMDVGKLPLARNVKVGLVLNF